MRITINLATRPFVELKPLYNRLRMLMALLAVVAIGLGAALYLLNRRERAAAEQMDALEQQTQAFQQELAQNEARMRRPENSAVLERAQFLNTVFAQKAFSWTSVMMDLEQMLPAGVQVTSLAPAVTADGEVTIHLRVSGPRDLQVDLLRNLEHSKRFLQPRLVNETAQTQENGRAAAVAQVGVPGGADFEILSGYNPLPIVKAEKQGPSEAEVSAAAKAGGVMGANPKSPARSVVPGGPLMQVPRVGPPNRASNLPTKPIIGGAAR